ncbi:MAG: hypothetical protein ACI8VC_002707 [Candidatus Endobugula sp.]
MAIKLDEIYSYLVNEEDARTCEDINDQACREVPKKFYLRLLIHSITKLADACASAKLVWPWLLYSVGAPTFLSGRWCLSANRGH